MPIVACACLCGGSDNLLRSFLKKYDYPEWLSISIPHGKQSSLSLIRSLPNFPERQALEQFVQNASKWAIIAGYNENGLRFADISHYNTKEHIDARHIIDTFA